MGARGTAVQNTKILNEGTKSNTNEYFSCRAIQSEYRYRMAHLTFECRTAGQNLCKTKFIHILYIYYIILYYIIFILYYIILYNIILYYIIKYV